MSEIVGRGQADTVIGHSRGFSINLSTTTLQSFDFSIYVGRYVKVLAIGGTISYCWGPLATLTTPVLVTGDVALNAVGVADVITDGSFSFEVPSAETPVLNVQASTTNVRLTVIPK
jgi:hypothetical protein